LKNTVYLKTKYGGKKMSFGDSVWDRGRSGPDELSKREYIAVVTLATVYGLVLSSVIAYFTLDWRPSFWMMIIVGFVIPIIGIVISAKSDEWTISLFGYTLLIFGIGAISGPAVSMLETGALMLALISTAGVTIVMSVAGIIYPKSLEHWGGYLFGGLLALLFVRIGQAILMSLGIYESLWYIPLVEYGAVILFSLYIVYDWNRALRLTRTLDNAIDCAVAIFLDIINLFWTIARILSNNND